jgi:hypothetical protein
VTDRDLTDAAETLMRPLQTEPQQYQEVSRRVHGAPPQRRWHVLRCCVERVGTRYSHAVLTQVYLEVLARDAHLPAPPVPAAWRDPLPSPT